MRFFKGAGVVLAGMECSQKSLIFASGIPVQKFIKKEKNMLGNGYSGGCCESCVNYSYDPESDCWCCEQSLDEDEMLYFMKGKFQNCPYFRQYDEYSVVKKQM